MKIIHEIICGYFVFKKQKREAHNFYVTRFAFKVFLFTQ